MSLKFDSKDLQNVILIADRVLIKPTTPADKTKSGLYLPPSVHEKEQIQQGYVVKVGPGYPIPAVTDADEAWKTKDEVKHLPLQVQVGDLAVFLPGSCYEIYFNAEKYFILPYSAILMVVRDEGLLS